MPSRKISGMSAQNPRSGSFIGSLAGMVGFSVLAGILVTVMLTPGLAVSSMATTSGISLFENLPSDISIGKQPQENKIYATAKNGDEIWLATVFSENREEVTWDNVSQFAKDAVVAGEDRRFYEHGGVDVQSIVRTAVNNVAKGGVEGGASTLTMQLIKNMNIQTANQIEDPDARIEGIRKAQETSFKRKLQEMKYAIALEKRYDKDTIMLAYLNIAGFGGNTYGIEAAAGRYYNTTAKDLTLPQAASLIAIVQQPTARAPMSESGYEQNKNRRDVILGNMLEEKMIDKAQYDEAIATPVDETTVTLTPPSSGCIAGVEYARQFCDYIVKNVPNFASLGTDADARKAAWKLGGYNIYTTLDTVLQKKAQAVLRKYAPPGEKKFRLGAASSIVQVGTGKILTMAQNKGFDDSAAGRGRSYTAINYNTDRPYGGSNGFQVGSTYKTFTLLNWLEHGHGLLEIVDVKGTTVNQASFKDSCGGPWGGPWKFRNFTNETGHRTVLNGTVHSINGAFVQMALQLDQCDTKNVAMRLGMHPAILTDNPKTPDVDESALQTNPSSILGTNDIAPLTLAAAYAALANKGTYCAPIAVDHIVDSNGDTLEGDKVDCRPGVTPDVAAAAVYALTAAMDRYAANPHDGVAHFGKTGTTNNSKQTWVVNTSTKVATVTWFGNINGNFPIDHYYNKYGLGANLRHYISREIMLTVDSRYHGSVSFPQPPANLLKGATIQVPDGLLGQAPETVKGIIEGLGLDYAHKGSIDSDLPVGTVAKVSPGSGSKISLGSAISVWVSRGNLYPVPDVVSDEQSFAAAQAELNTAGFTVSSKYCVLLDALDPLIGKVTESDPAPGALARKSKEIKLGVGSADGITC
jgi:membrane peptidoglycan carboxypeptidase